MNTPSRRDFFQTSIGIGAAALLSSRLSESLVQAADAPGEKIKLGLVTYEWAYDWDLPTIIANCEKSKVLGVELRTTHKHHVEPNLNAQQRQDVKKRFADSSVALVGLGTNEMFDSPDPKRVEHAIEAAKAFLQLSHDCGGSGVKVKPNDFHPGIPHEKTIEQIGHALNVLGKFAADLGQQVRLEVHGSCRDLSTIQQIMDVADHPSVAVCWNCNVVGDFGGKGLESNFNLVQKRLGATLHIHNLDAGNYPYQQLFDLLVKADYAGWALLECESHPKDPVAAMIHQRDLFTRLLAKAGK